MGAAHYYISNSLEKKARSVHSYLLLSDEGFSSSLSVAKKHEVGVCRMVWHYPGQHSGASCCYHYLPYGTDQAGGYQLDVRLLYCMTQAEHINVTTLSRSVQSFFPSTWSYPSKLRYVCNWISEVWSTWWQLCRRVFISTFGVIPLKLAPSYQGRIRMLQTLLFHHKMCSVIYKYFLNTISFKAPFQGEWFEKQERLPQNVFLSSLILVEKVWIQNVLTGFVFRRVTKYRYVLFSIREVKRMQCFDSDSSADCRVYQVSGWDWWP